MSGRTERYASTDDADIEMDIDMVDPSVRRRGRGFGPDASDDVEGVKSGKFERLNDAMDDAQEQAARCKLDAYTAIEGWIIVVTNVHEEATEDDVLDLFLEYGKVKDLHLNLDRRTGYVKGYALLQYETQAEAKQAIDACRSGLQLLEQGLEADFAFVQPPTQPPASQSRRHPDRARSRSPMRS
ncbi:proteasome regulatory particle subunit [Malassezia yamatoensis]|uniref:Proteasome regulatory particle subunit n=1 Tax=Malassezia yamatoensis TaxID=253288 RepID=A0AAJ5YRJ2_9BASI|nr:proteasome regulatory particle subunit [Malassezia yamatoensis]